MDLLAFKVVIEPDEDEWRSYYPDWEHLGGVHLRGYAGRDRCRYLRKSSRGNRGGRN